MKRAMAVLALLLGAAGVHAAVVAAPGWAVYAIPASGTVQGGVVRAGEAILVGRGDFGAGTESVVRIEGGMPTTIATGFSSLGGFDLDAAGTLYVVDNCLECGASTGDTVYAIPDALTRTTPVTAAGHEVVPAGTVPTAFDVLAVGPGDLLVTDAVGNGAGRVLAVTPGHAANLITGLDLTGGIARAADGSLRVVSAFLNMDFTTTGKVLRFALDGTPQGALVSGLAGGSGAAVDGDGNVLVTGIGSFGDTKMIAVAPDGSVTDRATGFAFSGDVFYDGTRDEALVVDFGVTDVIAICRDRDEDGVCDADDSCTGPAAIVKGKVGFAHLDTPSGDDSVAFKGEMAIPTDPALDPVATGVRILLEDDAGAILDAAIPGGAFDDALGTGWKAKKGTFKYKSGVGGIGGITKITLKVSTKVPGLVRFVVQGKKGGYRSSTAVHATLALDARAGECGDAALVCVPKKAGKVECK